MKNTCRVVAALLALVLVLTATAPLQAQQQEPRVLVIKTVQDLYDLADACVYDRYSDGLTVLLNANLDLKDKPFPMIPIFKGLFDGQNHTISGLLIDAEGSHFGFFRYCEAGAHIKNLVLEGVVLPKGDRESIGGLAGVNRGSIENCSFNGVVKGKNTVGGLVGTNAPSGQILNARASGLVYGERKTGGLTGLNEGLIVKSTNHASVNTTLEESKLDLQDLTAQELSFASIFTDATDVGGIAGASSGVIKNAQNHGAIGYPHVGYNIGGIAGRQSGHLSACTNHASVLGRKDVGGIVGQAQPHTTQVFSNSKLETLEQALADLKVDMDQLMQQLRASSSLFEEDLPQIMTDLDTSRDLLDQLLDQLDRITGEGIRALQEVNLMVTETLNRLLEMVDQLVDLVDALGQATALLEEAMAILTDLAQQMPAFAEEIADLLPNLEQALSELSAIRARLDSIQTTLQAVRDKLDQGDIAGVLALLQPLLDDIMAIMDSLQMLLETLDDLQKALTSFLEAHGQEAEQAAEALEKIQEATQGLVSVFDTLEDLLRSLRALLAYLTETDLPSFDISDDTLKDTGDDLLATVDKMVSDLSQLMDALSGQSGQMLDDLQAVSDQLFFVMDLLFDLLNESLGSELDPEDYIKDTSREDLDGAFEGKITGSVNLGSVDGDVNVGGIAGAMGFDLELDPEDDFKPSGSFTARSVYETRVILEACSNQGAVTGKKNHIGGIVGLMDIGYIIDSTASCSVTSTSGHYVGGIAGQASAPIQACYARCALSGGRYVGGIAGFANAVSESYSLVAIQEGQAYLGAIVGASDDLSAFEGNFFVSETLGGIDGISYQGVAEPLAYEALLQVKGLPDSFSRFQLQFWAQDQLIEAIEFTYGADLSARPLPEIPPLQDHYARWEAADLSRLTFDRRLDALYVPFLTLLESKALRDNQLPVVLVEGRFTETDRVRLDALDTEETYRLQIPDDGADSHLIRFMPAQTGRHRLSLLEDGRWVGRRFNSDGKYIVFEAPGNDISFQVQTQRTLMKPSYWAILIVLVLLAALVVMTVVRKQKRSKKQKEEQAQLDPPAVNP